MNRFSVSQTQNVSITIPKLVVKTDGNGNEADSSLNYHVDNRILNWYVKVYLDQGATDTLTITDVLPTGLTLKKIGLSPYSWNARNDANCYTSNVNTGGSDVSLASTGAKYRVNGNTLTVTTDQNYGTGTYLYLYIEAEYPECTNTGSKHEHPYENTASLKVGSTDLGSDSQTQTVMVPAPEEKPKVNKNSVWNGDTNQLKYQVLINPNREDLSAGSDSLTVEDIMSYNYSPWWNTIDSVLIRSSVKLYEVQKDQNNNVLTNADGTYVLGDEVTGDWSWTFSDNFTEAQWGTVPLKNTITAVVPDETTLVLTYIYEIKVSNFGGWNETTFQVGNNVTVTGDEAYSDDVSSNEKWQVSDVEAGATSSGTLSIYKVKKGNFNVILPGAEFTVYKHSDGTPLTDANGNVITFVSDETGMVSVSKGKGYFEDDVVYYIMETKAPTGYDLPETPAKYYFYFQAIENPDYQIPDNAVNLSTSYGVAYIENEQEAQHSVVIDKVWLDADGNTIEAPEGSISFHLIQTDYRGISEHFFHNTTKDGIQIYPHHSVIWTAPATGTVILQDITDAEIHDLLTGDVVTMTGSSFEATEGTPYQIMLNDDSIQKFDWYYSGNSLAGTLELENRPWSTTIAVPDEDSEGNKYSYTAQEITANGYVSEVTVDDNGDITITNRQKETTSITVEKAWRNASMIRKPVQIQLYQTIDTLYTEYTAYLGFINDAGNLAIGTDSPVTFTTPITGAGEYTIKWDLSLYGFQDSVGSQAFYVDIVDPHFALKGYTVSNVKITTDIGTYTLKADPGIGQHGGGYTRITFFNIWDDFKSSLDGKTEPQMSANGYLEVKFTLTEPTNDPNKGVLPALHEYVPSANFGGTALRLPIELSDSNNWTYTWNDLPLTGTDSDGNLLHYSYYVEELGDEYDVRYTYQYGISSGTIVVSNYPKSTADLTVNKQWLDASGNPASPPQDSVEYELEQEKLCTVMIYTGGWGSDNNSVQYLYVKPGTVITVTFIGHSINNPENYDTVIYTDGTTTLAYKGSDITDSELNGAISKVHYGYLGWAAIRKITVVRTITDTEHPTSICCNHGGYNDENNNGVPHYDGTYKLDNGKEVTLGLVSTSAPIPENYIPEFRSLGTYTLSELNSWTFMHEDVIPAIYRIRETTTGYTTTYIVNGIEEDADANGWVDLELEAGGSGTVTINNATATTSITVNKTWKDNGESSSVSRISFYLYQKVGSGEAVRYGDIHYMEKDSEGNWTATIAGLPIRDAEGNYYTYYVVETAMDGYRPTYSNGSASGTDATKITLTAGEGTNGSLGTITITNEAVTNIGVDKEWAEGTAKTNVVMELYQVLSTGAPSNAASGGTPIKSVTLGEETSDGWDKTWKNLPLYKFENGVVVGYYSYYVVEASNGYMVTYTVDGVNGNKAVTSGRVTVTNEAVTTDIGLEKEWEGENGGPVDVTIWQDYHEIPSGHTHSFAVVSTIAPTCVTQGYTNYYCSGCGLSYRDSYVSTSGHSYGDWTVTKNATCGEDGTRTRACSVCDHQEVEIISATGDHNWSAWTQVTAPTCNTPGLERRICSICGGVQTQAIPTTDNHTWGTGVWNSSTSKWDYTCSSCGATKSEDCAHEYGSVVTNPTCTARGYTTYTCSKCGHSYTGNATPATGHNVTSWNEEKAATCTEDGSRSGNCNTCGEKITQGGCDSLMPTNNHAPPKPSLAKRNASPGGRDGSAERPREPLIPGKTYSL